jgi:hypothetical protein
MQQTALDGLTVSGLGHRDLVREGALMCKKSKRLPDEGMRHKCMKEPDRGAVVSEGFKQSMVFRK